MKNKEIESFYKSFEDLIEGFIAEEFKDNEGIVFAMFSDEINYNNCDSTSGQRCFTESEISENLEKCVEWLKTQENRCISCARKFEKRRIHDRVNSKHKVVGKDHVCKCGKITTIRGLTLPSDNELLAATSFKIDTNKKEIYVTSQDKVFVYTYLKNPCFIEDRYFLRKENLPKNPTRLDIPAANCGKILIDELIEDSKIPDDRCPTCFKASGMKQIKEALEIMEKEYKYICEEYDKIVNNLKGKNK